MSLTYQPFAQTPEVDRLSHDLQMNLPDGERVLSGVIGFGLTAAGLARGGLTRWALLLAGGALLRRSLTGQVPCLSAPRIWTAATAGPAFPAIAGRVSKPRWRSNARLKRFSSSGAIWNSSRGSCGM